MELRTLLVADYANIEMSGKLNVMGIFDELNVASGFPVRWHQLFLVALLQQEFGELSQPRRLTIRLLDSDAGELASLAQDIQMPEPKSGKSPEVRVILGMTDIVFPQPGTYEFVVLVDNDSKGRIPLYVNDVTVKQE